MQQSDNPLSGIVEIDETYVGGKHKREGTLDNKTAVIGMVEKKKGTGQIAAVATRRADEGIQYVRG